MTTKKPKKHTVGTEVESDKLPTYPSLAACSGATGIPLAALKQAKKGGCDAFHQSGRVSLGKFLRWAFHKDNEAEIDWGDEFDKWHAKIEKIKHDKAARSVMVTDEADSEIRTHTATMFAELDRIFCSEFPPAVKGLEELAIRKKAINAIDELKTSLKQKFNSIAAKEKEEPKE